MLMMPFELSLLGNRMVLMLSKLVELLQLSPPRSEPVPMLSELGELLQLSPSRSEPVPMLSELGELLQLAFPRSEPPPLMKMSRLPKQLPLATPSYRPEISTALRIQVRPELQTVDATSVRSYCNSPTADNQKIPENLVAPTTHPTANCSLFPGQM